MTIQGSWPIPPPGAKFDSGRAKKWELITVDVRVPLRGDLYIGSDNKIHRCKNDRQFSKRSKTKIIVKESWLNG